MLAAPRFLPAAAPLEEYGFWDYTTPGAGGMEAYQWDDYAALLDDMAGTGMNSLVIVVKWATTGYRSRLKYLDQDPSNQVIRSDNALLRRVIDEAHRHKIRVWLGAVVNCFDTARFTPKPYVSYQQFNGATLQMTLGIYDTDTPGILERSVEVFTELAELFPAADGLEVELEGSGREVEHRIPLYNEWAKRNGRPAFDQIGRPHDPRISDLTAWRDYTTESRCRVLAAIEKALRSGGFRGQLAQICETGKRDYLIRQEVNLRMFHERFPDWAAITYEYNKWEHRYGMMDICIDEPKQLGLRVFYLGRGVMTWGGPKRPISLEQSWRMDVEDVSRFGPHGFWWFGSGAVNEGGHVALTRLRAEGYADGRTARKALLKTAGKLAPNLPGGGR